MTTLDDIAGRDASLDEIAGHHKPTLNADPDAPNGWCQWDDFVWPCDTAILLTLVREAREALDDIKKSVIFVGGFQHGRTNHRQHPLTCTDEFCRSSRAIEDRAEALLLRLTEGSPK